MQTSFLSTKLYFPSPRPSLVPRPRLVECLQTGLGGPLTLISAPAGYGKTTLLVEWRAGAGCNFPAAWFSIDSGDNNLFRFWEYLTAALETLQRGLAGEVTSLLQAPQLPPPEALVAALVNGLAGFTKDSALILDDYHLITSSEIHQYLICLLDHLPPHMHLVLLTRLDPSIPLARLRARGHLTEIRAADLRFTVAEAAAFLNQMMGLALTEKQVEILEQRTEGWIAGLQLAALTMQGHGDLESFVTAFTGSHRYVLDYLVEEVLSLQSERIRDFLLKTSILERMNAALCNTLTDESDGQAALEELERANLFVVVLDSSRQWYRYHHLFADVLQVRLRQTDPGRLLDMHRRAAGWLEQNGFLPEALHHALAAGDRENAGRLAELVGGQMLNRGELVALLGWLEVLRDLVPERPGLCIAKAWALALTGQDAEVEPLLGRAEQLLAGSPIDETSQQRCGIIAAIRCYLARHTGDAPCCLELGRQALEILPESNPGVRGVVHLSLGSAHILRGDFAAAIQSMREASRLGKLGNNLNLAVNAISTVATLLMAHGQLHQSEDTFAEAMTLARLPDGRVLPIAGRVHSGLCRLFYEWNDLAVAQEHARQAYELGQIWGDADSLVAAHVILARSHQARGDLRSAEESLRAAENLARTRQLTLTSAGRVEMERLSLWLARGNYEACERWRLANEASASNIDKPTLNSGKRLMLARIHLAQGDGSAALKVLSQLLRASEAAGNWGSVIELLALQSLAWQQKGNLPSALKALGRALALAEPEGYLRTFLDEGQPMLGLLRRAASKGLHPAYVRQILAAVAPAGESSRPVQPLIEPLSKRELEILRLIAAGKSNRQIAEELFLTVGTVKRHISNTFSKMNVQSRTKCLARARELDLLT